MLERDATESDLQGFARSYRPLIMGRRGAVGTNHPVAAQAGLDTLRAGGNAVDAAVAVAATLFVVEPHMSGLGGDAFYHVCLSPSARTEVFNGTGPAPLGASAERFASGGMAVHGRLSVSVPGALAGLASMHEAHGSLPWPTLFAAAIDAARQGFAVTHAYRHFSGDARAMLAADPRSRAIFLDASGAAPAVGALIRQEALAHTLEEIAADGAETFYRGAVAGRLAAGMLAAGVPITAADLAGCEAERPAPISISYRGLTVAQTPPNSTGFTFLQMLRMAERFRPRAARPGVAHPCAGRGQKTRLRRSRTLRHRSALRRQRADRPVAVRYLRG